MNSRVVSISAFLLFSLLINAFSDYIGSSFISKFSGSDLVTLLIVIFSINVATTNFIVSKINEFRAQGKTTFSKSFTSLKSSMVEQIILIIIAFVSLIIRESSIYVEKAILNIDVRTLINTILVFTIIYFVSILWEVGRSMFLISNFKPPAPPTPPTTP